MQIKQKWLFFPRSIWDIWCFTFCEELTILWSLISILYLIGSSFFHLRLLAKIKPFLSENSLEVAIHVFITTTGLLQLIYYGKSKSQISCLQVVQNAKCKNVPLLLKDLHWLPVNHRIEFKILLLVYKSLHVQMPRYLSNLLHPYNPSRTLRSEDQN